MTGDGMDWALRCPVCGVVWDKSYNYCPDCPGVLLIRVYAWQYEYDEFPEGMVKS